jgi:urease accessory protein
MIELIELVTDDGDVMDTLTLPYDLRQKSRQRVALDSGATAAIFLPPASRLCEGDRLRTSDGGLVAIRSSAEDVSMVRTGDPLQLAKACYHLGNRHVSLQIGAGWLRYQPDHVLDDMVRGLGLGVTHECAPFEPERGAYHGYGSGSGHSHAAHEHAHDHGQGHDRAHQSAEESSTPGRQP